MNAPDATIATALPRFDAKRLWCGARWSSTASARAPLDLCARPNEAGSGVYASAFTRAHARAAADRESTRVREAPACEDGRSRNEAKDAHPGRVA